jgi:hypothetical protein
MSANIIILGLLESDFDYISAKQHRVMKPCEFPIVLSGLSGGCRKLQQEQVLTSPTERMRPSVGLWWMRMLD